MRKKTILFLVLVLFSAYAVVSADGGKAGQAGAFLQLSLQARAAAMGGAFVGLSDDASGPLWNPAGSFQVRQYTFGAAYRKMTLDRKLSWVGFLLPVRNEASVGLTWINASVGELFERDDRGNLGEEISDYQNAVFFNFSRMMTEKILLGLNIKYIQHNLANLSSYGVGFDFGILVLPISKLRLGLAAQNVGMKYSWASGAYWKKFNELGTSSKDEFPVNFKLGASWMEFEDRLLTCIEVEKDNHQDVRFKIGAEYKILDLLAGRLGLNNGSLTFGMGLRQKFQNLLFMLDYAYLTNNLDLDPDHVLSIETRLEWD
jgi:hypothetical protein